MMKTIAISMGLILTISGSAIANSVNTPDGMKKVAPVKKNEHVKISKHHAARHEGIKKAIQPNLPLNDQIRHPLSKIRANPGKYVTLN